MSFRLDPAATALVLIDLQKGVVGQPLAPRDSTTVIGNCARLARHFIEKQAPVVRVNVTFSAGDRPGQEVDSPMQLPPGGLPADWADFVPELADLDAIAITKRQWGAFYGTELDLQLRRRRITTIVLAGISTPIGVEQTAREAWQHNYAVVLAEDACAASGNGAADMHRHSVEKILPRISRIRSTGEILEALS